MVPLLDPVVPAIAIAAREVSGSSMRTPPLKVGDAPMGLRIDNDGTVEPVEISS